MTDVLVKNLTEAGLSEKEAKVYIALLELELATAFEIAKHSGLNRSTTYVILESLKKKGLAGTSPDNPKVVQYFASSPDSLLHSVRSRAKHEQDVKDDLEQVLPELKALHKDTRHRPKVRVYEGKEGVREIFYSLFESPVKDLKTYANASRLVSFFPEFISYNQKRAKIGIKMYAINPASDEMINFLKKQTNPLPKGDQLLLIPEKKFRFPVNVGIYGNRVSFVSAKGDHGVIIENKEISDTLRSAFDLTWEEAKREDKKIRGRYF